VPGHIAAFVLSFLAVAVAAPIVEESMFRGLGFRLLAKFGRTAAIVAVGVAFGLAHGIPEALPILIPLGAGLAWLRDRTDSIYPGMVLHGLFNAVQVVVAVF
jgi:membrane protease YdiL (CAAX protease family)